jgi:hypothetical protein
MSICGKYNSEERRIVRQISDVRVKMRYYRKKYLDLDVKLSFLKAKLQGKYKRRVSL